ncbi:hypothetical protein KIN20_027981 [Parelaphostrongylus tenuis]|uniref:Uncharacterized protein n=1 Tax=Parelaphostrongylus tenuis TaxID=148309 RepID=A0AAD5R056_PARTN|nr:hypothetical protein KIN20_027981 [Parelaphostrongylus tenuis]
MMDLLSVEMCIDSYKTKMNMAKFSTVSLVISLAATFSVVFGCGVLPAGQESSRPFTVTGFTTLPVAMVYSTATNVQATFPGIATSEAGAVGFVQRLVMETIFDVLERQGRSALLPDAVISAILGQLSVTISYKPLSCEMAGGPDQMCGSSILKTIKLCKQRSVRYRKAKDVLVILQLYNSHAWTDVGMSQNVGKLS